MPRRLLAILALGLLVNVSGGNETPTTPTPTPAPASPASPAAPATRPATQWAEVVDRLAIALVDPQARQNEAPLFLPQAEVRRLPDGDGETPAVLRGPYDGQIILSAGSYVVPQMKPAATVGADVAVAVKNSAGTPAALPADIVAALTPPDAATDVAGAIAAEMAASRWLISTLRCIDGDRIGLIVLWKPASEDHDDTGAFGAARAEVSSFHQLSFIVVLGRQDRLGRWRVASVRHGTAAQVLAEPPE